jgi:hypothetical protein
VGTASAAALDRWRRLSIKLCAPVTDVYKLTFNGEGGSLVGARLPVRDPTHAQELGEFHDLAQMAPTLPSQV